MQDVNNNKKKYSVLRIQPSREEKERRRITTDRVTYHSINKDDLVTHAFLQKKCYEIG